MAKSIPYWKRVLLRHLQNVGRGLKTVDHVLRGRVQSDESSPDHRRTDALSFAKVLVLVAIAGPLYGFAMGSFAGIEGSRSWSQQWQQMLYSGIKVPILIAMTLIISLPSFFVINTLFGLRDEFRESLRAIVSAQAGLAIILASMLPLTILVYLSLSTEPAGYARCVIFNTFIFGLASVSAQVLLRKYYRPLIDRNPKQKIMVRFWIFIYAFVGIQAAYVLRPFIGSPNTPISFFRDEPFENAYVVVFRLTWNLFAAVN